MYLTNKTPKKTRKKARLEIRISEVGQNGQGQNGQNRFRKCQK